MSITSVKSGATGISLALDNNFMEPIATVLVGSGGSVIVEFKDIPQTYKHLQIRGIARAHPNGTLPGAGTYGFYTRLNGVTNNIYANHALFGNGSSAGSSGVANSSFAAIVNYPGSGATANAFGIFVCDILDYTNTNKTKTIRTLGGYDGNDTNGIVILRSDLFNSNNEIVSIQISPSANQNTLFAQHSRFSLYGIKG